MNIDFQYVNENNLDQCINILCSFFGPNYHGAEKKYLKWQYFDSVYKNEVAEANEYSILAVVNDGKILALDAFLPWKTIVSGNEVMTFWDIEWINDSKRKGLGRELLKELRSRCQIYCGYGLNKLSKTAYKNMAYDIADHIERKIAILNKESCTSLFAGDGNKEKIDFISENAIGISGKSYCEIYDTSLISDRYWTSQIERFDCISYKGLDYLKWRYIEHPYFKYHIISLDRKAETGLAVVRMEKIKYNNFYVMRVLDLLPVIGNEQDLVNTVLQFGIDHGGILADFFCVSSRYADIVCPAPFIGLKKHIHFDIPMLFQPMEIRKRKSINMVLDCNKEYSNINFDIFYATKADGDQDVFLNDDYRTISL